MTVRNPFKRRKKSTIKFVESRTRTRTRTRNPLCSSYPVFVLVKVGQIRTRYAFPLTGRSASLVWKKKMYSRSQIRHVGAAQFGRRHIPQAALQIGAILAGQCHIRPAGWVVRLHAPSSRRSLKFWTRYSRSQAPSLILRLYHTIRKRDRVQIRDQR